MFGDNELYQHAFEKDVLCPGIYEGQTSVLIMPAEACHRVSGLLHFDDFLTLCVDDFADFTEANFFDVVEQALSKGPRALFLSLPDGQDKLSQAQLKVIRRFAQQTIMWIQSNFKFRGNSITLGGLFYLSEPERYLVEQQSGLMLQIEHLRDLNFCTGYHYKIVPESLCDFSGLSEVFSIQTFVIRISENLRKHTNLCKLIKSHGKICMPWYRNLLPCPRTLVDKKLVL